MQKKENATFLAFLRLIYQKLNSQIRKNLKNGRKSAVEFNHLLKYAEQTFYQKYNISSRVKGGGGRLFSILFINHFFQIPLAPQLSFYDL